MRFAILSLAAFVALVFGPQVDLGAESRTYYGGYDAQIETMRLDHMPQGEVKVQGLPNRVGAAALTHLFRPRLDTMPVLPDLPARAAMLGRDTPPALDFAPPQRSPAVEGDVTRAPVTTASLSQDAAAPRQVSNEASEIASVVPLRSAGKFVTPPAADALISGNRLALRTGPAKRYPSVAALSRGTNVRITGPRQGGYVPVRVAGTGQAGWVFHSYVSRSN